MLWLVLCPALNWVVFLNVFRGFRFVLVLCLPWVPSDGCAGDKGFCASCRLPPHSGDGVLWCTEASSIHSIPCINCWSYCQLCKVPSQKVLSCATGLVQVYPPLSAHGRHRSCRNPSFSCVQHSGLTSKSVEAAVFSPLCIGGGGCVGTCVGPGSAASIGESLVMFSNVFSVSAFSSLLLLNILLLLLFSFTHTAG